MTNQVNLAAAEEAKSSAMSDMDPRLQLLVARMRTGVTKAASASTAENEAAVIARVTDSDAWMGLSEVRDASIIGKTEGDGTIVTGRIPVSRIEKVRNQPFVESLKAAQPMRPMLAVATAETEAQLAQMPTGHHVNGGAGVIVGVIDYDGDFVHKNFRKSNGKTRLLSMNRLIPGKGYEFLVEVLSKLPPTASLTIAGEGELLDSLKMLAQNLKCADRITFPGWVSGAEKQALFDESDAFCLFTLRDCMSTVLLEAMANGLPIVAYEYGPTLDLVPRSAGIFVKPEESAEHAAGLIQNLNPSQKTQMGMAAKRWVLENYSAEIVTREWLALLSQLAVETGENRRVAT